MTILTQDSELVNYSHIRNIAVLQGEDEAGTTAFVIRAEYAQVPREEPQTVDLGIYVSEADCVAALDQLCEAITDGRTLIRM